MAEKDLYKRELEWLISPHCGRSSKAIIAKMNNLDPPHHVWVDSHPRDPWDFYRCFNLLRKIPEYRGRLHEMKTISSTWKRLVENWDELEKLCCQGLLTEAHNKIIEYGC